MKRNFNARLPWHTILVIGILLGIILGVYAADVPITDAPVPDPISEAPTPSLAPPRSEVEWCKRLAPKYGADTEVRLWDGTRCDLVGSEYAYEAEWPTKWAESIGQASYYALVLDKKPAIILLVKDLDRERRYVYRCQTVCAALGIRLCVETVE